ncbi:MAG: hypothetical protein M3Z04_04790 [Chloroflexota bacterium]|nr:hypothetical protein [Chloroflexota bacterium]
MAVTLMTVLLQTQPARGTDPDTLDSTYMASGPVVNQQTVVANQAWADAIETREVQNREYALAHPETLATKNPHYVPPTSDSEAEPTVVEGIYTDRQRPMGWGMIYDIKNYWMGSIEGGHAQVYAGLRSDSPDPGYWVVTPPGQGVLVVMTFPHGTGTPDNGGLYLTPTRIGTIHIAAAAGTCLTVQATNGDQLMFDVARRIWSCTR